MAYRYFNNNPMKRNVGDCSVRAISKALGIDWESAYITIMMSAYAMCDMPSSDAVWGAVTPIATAIVVSGEERTGSRSIFTPTAVDTYGNVTSRAIVDVPKGCCFTVSVEYVNGTVDDPTVVPTPLISVIDGSLSVNRIA